MGFNSGFKGLKLLCNFLLLQLKEDWYHENITIVTNKRNLLSIEGKVKVIEQRENGKKGS